MKKEMFNKYSEKYDAWYEKNKFAYLSEIEALKKVVPKAGRGLEIGVGTGRFASALGIAMGIDPSREMIEIAAQRGVTARWGFGEDLPFWDNTFDYVACIVALSFVTDPLKVLQEARRVLKNKGTLIVAIIDRDSFLGKFYQIKEGIFYKKAHLFTVKEVTDLLTRAGFNRFSYYQTIFQLPEEIAVTERPQRGFGKGGFVVVRAEKVIKK